MGETLRKKLQEALRKECCKNLCLGFKGDEYKLFDKLPLDAYRKLEQELTDDEFYELQSIFCACGKEKECFAIISSQSWFSRCCRDFRVFDRLSDEQLETMLNKCWGWMSELFEEAQRQDFIRCCRMMKRLHEDNLGGWINSLTNFSKLNEFLVWLYEREKHVFVEAKELFQKLANLSDKSIAKLLENTDVCIVKRILQELHNSKRDIFPIYQEVQKDKLYEVIVKSDYELLNNANDIVYSWIYSNIAEEKREDFSKYLADEKRFELQLFNEEICSGIYKVLWEGDEVEFIKEIFKQKGIGGFTDFYKILSSEEKERMFDLLLKDEKGMEIVEIFLETKRQEELSLLERLIKKTYVTK